MGQYTAPGDQLVVSRELTAGMDGRRESDRIHFPAHGLTSVTVTRTGGHGARLWFTTDGSAPTTTSPWRWLVDAGGAPGSVTAPVPPGTGTVRVNADEDCTYDVQAF